MRCGIRGNVAPNSRPRKASRPPLMFLSCLFVFLSEIHCTDGAQNVYSVTYEMKCHEFTMQDGSRACEKQMALMSCLARRGHELLELLMFFLIPNPDPFHQLCEAATLRVHFAFHERACFFGGAF